MTVEEKDRWWLENLYQGNAPQMTLRVVVCGFLLGGLLATTNLYVGAKIGVTLGTAITAVVVASFLFNSVNRIGLGRRFHGLEGAMIQSISCSAGYMSSPLTASMGAYIVVSDTVVPWWQMMLWLVGIAILGVLFAIPLKRRFINIEQAPFPEGRACGVLLEMLHDDDALVESEGDVKRVPPPRQTLRPARLLIYFGLAAGVLRFLQSQPILEKLRIGFLAIPENLDAWYYRLAIKHDLWLPTISGIPLRELTIRPSLDLAVLSLGGLMGIRICLSLMVGAIVNYCILAPWMIHRGDIISRFAADGTLSVGFRAITTWSLWGGAAIMTSAALWSFFADRRLLAGAFRIATGRRAERTGDPLGQIEIPNWVFVAGVPFVGGGLVWMAHAFFGVPVWLAALSIPLVFFLTIIAVNATALTSMTPHGALGKVTQLTCGVLEPRGVTSNIVAASISAEVAFQASNFIQNLKPGYMVGAKPRLQAIGHLIGAVSGAIFGVAVFYAIFLKNNPSALICEAYPFPAIVVWKAIAEVLAGGLSGLAKSAVISALLGAMLGIALEFMRRATKGWCPLSPIGFGLAFVIPFDICLAMFAGAAFFWMCKRHRSRAGYGLAELMVENQETICAGVVAGSAIVGVAVMVLGAY